MDHVEDINIPFGCLLGCDVLVTCNVPTAFNGHNTSNVHVSNVSRQKHTRRKRRAPLCRT